MATVDVEIASRRYSLACRDGEEAHLRAAAALVDGKARDAAQALGNMTEARLLLFASLLLADSIIDAQDGVAPPPVAQPDPRTADALEQLAERMEKLAARLEDGVSNT